jgi:ABC-2 type transport system ATP-binding protein
LLSDPQVLFLDEPTVGLDPRIRYELLDIIAALRARSGTTVLLTTHYLDEAERLCDRVAIMHEGAIVALDSPASLLAELGDEVIELQVDGAPDAMLHRLRVEGIAGSGAFAVGATLTIPVRGRTAADVVAAINRIGLSSRAMTTRAPTLDDVYLRLTGDRIAA